MTRAEYFDSTHAELAAVADACNRREERRMRWSSWLMANLCTLVANVFRDAKAKPVRFDVDDFMPESSAQSRKARAPQSTETLKFMARALAASGWGRIKSSTTSTGGDN